jgi:hypothetical protein
MIKPVGLVNGHYECRSLEQTVPILRELLALEIVSQGNGDGILEPGPIGEKSGRSSFLFTDPDGNCWEILAAAN